MPKVKFELEFVINASAKLLYSRLSTPSGLAEWFADDVHLRGKNFAFIWDKTEQEAKVLMRKPNEYIRFRWENEEDEYYFEFKITKEELTNSVSLLITDFADEDEMDDSKSLWEKQVGKLQRALGV
ncbi:MAG: START-like domain-containing protein [Bacteroidales bacterium]